LLVLSVCPKELIGHFFATNDQHPDKIIEATSWDAFYVKVNGRITIWKFGRTMDIDFVFPECLRLQGEITRFRGVLRSFGCPPWTECVRELMQCEDSSLVLLFNVSPMHSLNKAHVVFFNSLGTAFREKLANIAVGAKK
jgi:hypothetical protein